MSWLLTGDSSSLPFSVLTSVHWWGQHILAVIDGQLPVVFAFRLTWRLWPSAQVGWGGCCRILLCFKSPSPGLGMAVYPFNLSTQEASRLSWFSLCLSYFSVAVIRNHDLGNFKQKEFNWALVLESYLESTVVAEL